MANYHPCDDLHERPAAARDLANFLCGDFLGHGASRWVYAHPLDKTCVVKFEQHTAGRSVMFQNQAEWMVWKAIEGSKLEKWFAPCMAISHLGLWLIQKRVEPMPRSRRPKRVPAFFNDLKDANFGILDGRVVVCDYGIFLREPLFRGHKLVEASWYEET